MKKVSSMLKWWSPHTNPANALYERVCGFCFYIIFARGHYLVIIFPARLESPAGFLWNFWRFQAGNLIQFLPLDLSSKLNASAIAWLVRACASANIWLYWFKVVLTTLCPKSADTATTSMPALMSIVQCKCLRLWISQKRTLCASQNSLNQK